MSDRKSGGGPAGDEQVLTRKKRKVARPKRWKVLLHNDDYTTMDFVVEVLVQHFKKSQAEAMHVMLQVHQKGVGTAGIYPRDVAETKVSDVMGEARAQNMPLQVSAEPE